MGDPTRLIDEDYGEEYEQWEESYAEGSDGHIDEAYLLDPDEGFSEEDLLFAENAFSPSMWGRAAVFDGAEQPDVERSDQETDDATTDPFAASETGKTYLAPEDPPIRPSKTRQDAEIAIGFGDSYDDVALEIEDVPERFADADLDIAQRVTEALRLHSYTSDMDIRVQVTDGVVTLRGRVDSLQDIAIVEDIASEVEGVEAVREQLTLR
ncbi:MAG: BON domain-containing protein [Anaerolineae bacterium]